MNKVKNTNTYEGSKSENDTGPCFRFIREFQKSYPDHDWKKPLNIGAKCTVETLEFATLRKRRVKTYWFPEGTVPVTSSIFGVVTTGFSDHGIGRVCCGEGEKKKCMYFDIGYDTKYGEFGGSDRWFSASDVDFRWLMDLRTEQTYPKP